MKSILVVDDEASILAALEFALSSEGYDVTTARSGEEALLSINDRIPHLVLLDIMMTGMSGLDTLKMLKAHPHFKNIPVVLLSAAHPLGKQSTYGWSDFVQKPFALDDLLVTIKKHI